jgi:predicted deacetylase
MVSSPPRLLLASIHDVSPRFESEIDRLVDLLTPHTGGRLAMRVVPNHWESAPIVQGSPFAARLRNWAGLGIEIFLHGFFHRDTRSHDRAQDRLRARFMTAGEGEFLGLSQEQASARLEDGRALVEDAIGRPIDGFVAPAWLYGPGALKALAQSSIPLAEDHMRVWAPATGEVLARGPVITWASRTRLRLGSSLLAAAALRRSSMKVLRIGVHPPDVHHAAIVRSIEATLKIASKHRRAGRYADLLAA